PAPPAPLPAPAPIHPPPAQSGPAEPFPVFALPSAAPGRKREPSRFQADFSLAVKGMLVLGLIVGCMATGWFLFGRRAKEPVALAPAPSEGKVEKEKEGPKEKEEEAKEKAPPPPSPPDDTPPPP